MPGEGEALLQVEVALTDGTTSRLIGDARYCSARRQAHSITGLRCRRRYGRRVVVANSAPCVVRCAQASNLCERLFALNGAYAELLVVPERIARMNLLPFPRSRVRSPRGQARSPACGIDVAGVQRGDSVAVVGLGRRACSARASPRGGHPLGVGSRAGGVRARTRIRRDDRRSAGADIVIEAAVQPGVERAPRLVAPAERCSPSSCRVTPASMSTRTASTTKRCG